jgi:chromosome partitioning protein
MAAQAAQPAGGGQAEEPDTRRTAGVGKTTTVANLAAAWGSQGRRILAVDFDPQFALTRRFGIDPSERSTIVDVLEGMILKAKTAPDVGDVVVGEATPLVDVVPAHRRLADVETSLVREIKRETFLRRALRGHIDP